MFVKVHTFRILSEFVAYHTLNTNQLQVLGFMVKQLHVGGSKPKGTAAHTSSHINFAIVSYIPTWLVPRTVSPLHCVRPVEI